MTILTIGDELLAGSPAFRLPIARLAENGNHHIKISLYENFPLPWGEGGGRSPPGEGVGLSI
jgi:hypothetical protein